MHRFALVACQPRPRPEIHRRLRREPGQGRVGGDVLGHFGRLDLVRGVVFGAVVVEVPRAFLAEPDGGRAVARHRAEIGSAAGLAARAQGDAQRFELGLDGFDDRPGRVADAGRDFVDQINWTGIVQASCPTSAVPLYTFGYQSLLPVFFHHHPEPYGLSLLFQL